MPPIVQKKYCPLYRIDHWVTFKSYQDKQTQRSIYHEIKDLLDISQITLWRIRRTQVGEEGTLSTADLIKLKDYFNCTLDDLVVASPPVDPGSPDSSPEVAGIISDTNSTPSI